jgi:hypothetical protein
MDDLERAERILAIANRVRRASGGFKEFRLADCESEGGGWVVLVRRDGARAHMAQAERDAAFLEHAREDVAFLLDEIERLKREAEDE